MELFVKGVWREELALTRTPAARPWHHTGRLKLQILIEIKNPGNLGSSEKAWTLELLSRKLGRQCRAQGVLIRALAFSRLESRDSGE